jgi:methyltransferase-like protein/16S rRNA G527 N7-methylase RsmG
MKTLKDYDELPYSDCPISVSRPDNLYVIGRLFQLQPAPPDNCKVLELGCAGGGNLIPLAFYWPNSEFVGVELSQHQAAQANQIIKTLQLSNISILHQDLMTLLQGQDQEFGHFDYIIAHGVYSWVPAEVQQQLLTLCNVLLKPDGIAYISYNTLPGWEQRNMLRDMMRYHSRNAATTTEQLNKSLEMLTLLHKGMPENGSLSERWVRLQAEELLEKPANYVYHDYLEKHNTPVYFHQFAQQAAQHQLQYFAEASLYTMLSSTLTTEAEAALDQFEDPIEYEQYMDFFYLKHFRQSLLCHAQRNPQRQINLDVLKECYFYSDLYIKDDIDLFAQDPQSFTSPSGDSYVVSHPMSKAALAELLMAYPGTYGFDELKQRAAVTVRDYGDAKFADDADSLFSEIVNLYLSGAINVTTVDRQYTTAIEDKPKFNALSRIFCQFNKFSLASVHHDSIALNQLQRKLIKLADGQHDLHQITAGLSKAINENENLRADYVSMRNPLIEKGSLSESKNPEAIDPDFVRQAITNLAYLGLLDVACLPTTDLR